jgi:predicted membrane metal-binding protein
MYRFEWIFPLAPLGAVALLMVPIFGAMLGLVLVLLVAVAIVVALVVAIVAPPFLLVRAIRGRGRSNRTTPAYIGQAKAGKASHQTAVAVSRVNATAS